MVFHRYVCESQIVLRFVTELLTNIVVLHDGLPPRWSLPRHDSTHGGAKQSKIWVFGGRNGQRVLTTSRFWTLAARWKDKVTSVRKWLSLCEYHNANCDERRQR